MTTDDQEKFIIDILQLSWGLSEVFSQKICEVYDLELPKSASALERCSNSTYQDDDYNLNPMTERKHSWKSPKPWKNSFT